MKNYLLKTLILTALFSKNVLAADVTYNKEGEIININPIESKPAETYYNETSNQSNLPKNQPIIKKPIEIPIPRQPLKNTTLNINNNVQPTLNNQICLNNFNQINNKRTELSRIYYEIGESLNNASWKQDINVLSKTGKWKESTELGLWTDYLNKNLNKSNADQCINVTSKISNLYDSLIGINSDNLDSLYNTQSRTVNIVSESMCSNKQDCSKVFNSLTQALFIKNYYRQNEQLEQNINDVRNSLYIFSN